MILPATHETALMLLALSLLLSGSWANLQKIAGVRFELYYFDFALGALVSATLAGFTLGSMGQELSFLDNLDITGRRQIALVLGAGAVFNLGNMLLAAAISLAGLAAAFALTAGVALATTAVWRLLLHPPLSPGVWMGMALALAAAAGAGWVAVVVRKKTAVKTIVLAVVSGIALASAAPLVERAAGGDIGLGPYPIAFVLAAGILFSTLVFNLYFLNLPVEGESLTPLAYLKGSPRQHLAGIAAGAMWLAGSLLALAVRAAPRTAQPDAALVYTAGASAALVSMVWGLAAWKEHRGAGRAYAVLWLSAMLYLAGVISGAMALTR